MLSPPGGSLALNAILGNDLACLFEMVVTILKPSSQDGLWGGFQEAVSRSPAE